VKRGGSLSKRSRIYNVHSCEMEEEKCALSGRGRWQLLLVVMVVGGGDATDPV